jgi:hypothetical protein
MAPLLTFVAAIKGWHVIVVGALGLAFAGMGYFTGSAQMPAASRIHSALAVPTMIAVMAFLIFAVTTEKFGPAALFPSIFVALTIFSAVAITGYGLRDADFSYRVHAVLGLCVSFMMSGLLCGMIAIKQKLGG